MSESRASFDPDAWLDSLEPIGWRLGLERMEALCEQLGRPQDRFGTIHVVGTNGKSSVARMAAAVLDAHGLRAGCLVSPHLSSWSERVLVEGRELEPAAFADSVRETARAAEEVNRGLEPGDSVTQFEISTAAGFVSLAEAGVEVAAVEAGLGGRLDASNTIESAVTVLTSIGLDHTEWLGQSEVEIAAEKLAVLRPDTTLVLGPVAEPVRELALRTADALACGVVEPGTDLPPGLTPGSPAIYQRGNFALAIASAEQYLKATGLGGVDGSGSEGGPASEGGPGSEGGSRSSDDPGLAPGAGLVAIDALETAATAAAVPGRLELVAEDPRVFFDVAHNRPAAAALAESVPHIAGGSPVFAVISILDDKDARGILAELAPVLEGAIFTDLPPEALAGAARPGARGHDPDELLEIAERISLRAEVAPDPVGAISRARELAREHRGVVLAAGSHFLLRAARQG